MNLLFFLHGEISYDTTLSTFSPPPSIVTPMKILMIMWVGLLGSNVAFSHGLESRVAELEARTDALEAAVKEKLGDCKLKYVHHTYRLNRCARGTFARAVTHVGGNQVQMECGYYRLECTEKETN